MTVDAGLTGGAPLPAKPAAQPEPLAGAGAPKERRTLPLAGVLALAIGGLVAVAVVLAITVLVSAANTRDLLTRNANLLIDTLGGFTRTYLDTATDQLVFLAARDRDGAVDLLDPAQAEPFLTAALAAAPQVAALLLYDRAGVEMGVYRAGGQDIEFLIDQSEVDRAVFERGAARFTPDQGAHWGELVYVNPVVTSVLNARHPIIRDGGFGGMLVSSVSVRELSQLMVELGADGEQADRYGSVPFLLYGRHGVLAHPTLAQYREIGGLSQDKPLPTLWEVEDPWLGHVWDLEPADEVNLDGAEAGWIRRAADRAERVFLLKRIDGYADQPLYLGVHFPSETVTVELQRLFMSIVAALIVSVLAVLAAVLLGRAVARPIRELSERSKALAGLEFGRVTALPPSRFRELDDQARAFNAMIRGLVWFETYVPKRLVRRLVGEGLAGDGIHATIRSEERELTVMFTDIVGFTQMSEDSPAVEVARFLNQHFQILTQAVEAEGGTVDKYIGDSLMAFWGAPETLTDHAERACRAALAIADASEADNRDRAAHGLPPVRLRIGLHTGTVVVGNIGTAERMNYTIVGDTVNAGNRIESLGRTVRDPGGPTVILISERTRAQLRAAFLTESIGTHALRGRSESLTIYRLYGASDSIS